MSDEVKRRLFEPFFTTKPPGQGTGMGLAAVYAAVTSHLGAIEVTNAPGDGTTVTIDLPVPAEEPARARPSERAPMSPGSARILLADDEPEVRFALSAVLREMGYHVAEYDDGEDALRAFRDSPTSADLVVLDVLMPRLGGAAALREMRRIRPEVPAILVSGNAVESDMQEMLVQPGVVFLAKPCSLGDLASSVSALLGRRMVRP